MRISFLRIAGVLTLSLVSPALHAQAVDDGNDWTAASHKIRPVLTPSMDMSLPTRPMQAPLGQPDSSMQTPSDAPQASQDSAPAGDSPETTDAAPSPLAPPADMDSAQAQALGAPVVTPQSSITPSSVAPSNSLSSAASQAMMAQAQANAAATNAQNNLPYPPAFQAQQMQQMQNNLNPMGTLQSNNGYNGYGNRSVLVVNH